MSQVVHRRYWRASAFAALSLSLVLTGGTAMAADPTPTASATASATATSSPSAEATEAATDGATADATEAADDAAADAEEQPVAAEGFVPEHEGWPNATEHSQQAYSPTDDFTAKWTRADAMQIQRLSNPDAASGESSLPEYLTMPEISNGFPATNSDKVWVWDTWTLTDDHANQISYNGWEIIFSLVADRDAGYSFDDRHTHARMGFFYRKAGTTTSSADGASSSNGGWIYGGHVFPDGASGSIFEDQSFSHQTEWSGSARLMPDSNKIRMFYTAVAFYREPTSDAGYVMSDGVDYKPQDPHIVQSEGRIHADENGVWLTGFRVQHDLLTPDGKYYQSRYQNQYLSFRDPFTFVDQTNPSDSNTYMVFEGNTAYTRAGEDTSIVAAHGQNTTAATCKAEDLGYQDGDPEAESLDEVNAAGAYYQLANVGLAVSENKAMTKWKFLPPILSGNCVNDQTERPQIYFKDGKSYLFTISHRSTYASGMMGPEGVYGFVGNGIRSDYQPLNENTGIALGNPINLNYAAGSPYAPDWNQSPYAYQSYSHYIQPGGLVESFIDSIGGNHDGNPVRGGSLAPTVKLDIHGTTTSVDRSYGTNGLGGFGDIPSNKAYDPGYDER